MAEEPGRESGVLERAVGRRRLHKSLRIVSWARPGVRHDGTQDLHVDLSARAIALAHAPATGKGLVSNGDLGIDLIRVEAGKGFQPHTHRGDHILIVAGGEGTIAYDGIVYPTQPGDLYMIDGGVPHAVGARTDHVILAVGCPHRPIDADDRMVPLEYHEVLSDVGDLTCLICNEESRYPSLLHDVGCKHCPCTSCSWGLSHHGDR